MHTVFPFARNVFDHHLSWVGGGLTVLGAGELVVGKKLFIAPKWALRVGAALLFISCCQAWFDEHRNVQTLIDEKAILTGQNNGIQGQLALKEKPIVLQVPETKPQVRTATKPNIQQKSEGANSPNVVGNENQFTYAEEPIVRQISDTQIAAISKDLLQFAPRKFWVIVATGMGYQPAPESAHFSDQLQTILRKANWTSEQKDKGVLLPYFQNVMQRGVAIHAPQSGLAAANALNNALSNLLIRSYVVANSSIQHMIIVIGT